MNTTSIKEIAEATQMSVDFLLTDIVGTFGDDYPDVHSWNADTLLPDDTLTYKILEIYNIKQEVSAQLPKGELTTLPEMLLATSGTHKYALSTLVSDFRLGIADFLRLAVIEAVTSSYNEAKAEGVSVLQNLIESDLKDLDQFTYNTLNQLQTNTKNSYKIGEELQGKLTTQSYQRSQASAQLGLQISNLVAGLKR